MEVRRLSKIILYGELSTGHRDIGAPKKRFKKRPSKEIPVSLPHRSSSVVSPCRWPRSLATRRSPVNLLLWEQPQSCPWREAQEEEELHRLSINPGLVIPLQPLWQSVDVTYWPCQPPASLRQTWTTPLIFVCKAKPNMAIPFLDHIIISLNQHFFYNQPRLQHHCSALFQVFFVSGASFCQHINQRSAIPRVVWYGVEALEEPFLVGSTGATAIISSTVYQSVWQEIVSRHKGTSADCQNSAGNVVWMWKKHLCV